ncbi:ABC transporter ATP-binding protein [Frigoribacterium sp. VKM Ac-2836]|uniref:ABC transporter ATP-binding protein n=1 Tax=Frigoribacterium sp. VKM Ac-2836 TaxID=2739014 RepID=UPI0015635424|nr:ATP-binding cassette domain-containing protein [Frigoribacterium sp. VKM Ac-2836]NRD25323.1 ATP-binding cassette domain-containing protein [Frigoribacterium sp. VKM Ac-2836]
MNEQTPLPLEAHGLRKAFRGRPRIDDVTFSVRPGRVVGLLGPNGAGKTTTIRLLLGLVSRDAGDALVFGVPYRDLERPPQQVGVVLDAGGLHPSRSGRQHLTMAALRAGVGADRVEAVLAEVGMSRDADRRAGTYSLGMRQRIAIAAALLGEPRLLVLDEPANGLDPAGMHWLRQKLRAFAAAGGTVLVSSHLLSDIQEIADDVVVITDGRVVAEATMAEVLADPSGTLEGYYLEVTGTEGMVR